MCPTAPTIPTKRATSNMKQHDALGVTKDTGALGLGKGLEWYPGYLVLVIQVGMV